MSDKRSSRRGHEAGQQGFGVTGVMRQQRRDTAADEGQKQ